MTAAPKFTPSKTDGIIVFTGSNTPVPIARVLQCVNAHDELVAALAAVLSNCDHKPNQDLLSFQNVRAIRDALAKVGAP